MSVLHTRLLQDPAGVERELAAGKPEHVLALCACVRVLDPQQHASLVLAVMRLPWLEADALASAVLEFVQDLVSAVPAFIKICVDALISSFLPNDKLPASSALTKPASAAILPRVHEALRGVLRACPLGIGCALPDPQTSIPPAHVEPPRHSPALNGLTCILLLCAPNLHVVRLPLPTSGTSTRPSRSFCPIRGAIHSATSASCARRCTFSTTPPRCALASSLCWWIVSQGSMCRWRSS